MSRQCRGNSDVDIKCTELSSSIWAYFCYGVKLLNCEMNNSYYDSQGRGRMISISVGFLSLEPTLTLKALSLVKP